MRIGFITPGFPLQNSQSRGGTEVYLENLAKVLLERGHEVHVVVYGDNVSETRKPVVPVKLHCIPLRHWRYISHFLPGWGEGICLRNAVRQLDRQIRFDIIEGSNDEGVQLFVAREFGARYWMRLHSSLRQHIEGKQQRLTAPRKFAVWLDRQAVRNSSNLVTHSRLHAAEMAKEYGIAQDRMQIVPHGVPASPPFALRHTIPPTLAYIGTLDQRKGIDLFLKAVPQIPSAQFLVIGRDGGDSPSTSWKHWFENTFPEQCERVTFTGFVDPARMEILWQNISVAVVPSRYESFGFVVVEAFQRGIPVVASTGGALPETAKDGALYFQSGDVDSLATVVNRCLDDGDSIRALVMRARALYEEHYTLQHLADNVERAWGSRAA
jgi:glycogen synthase